MVFAKRSLGQNFLVDANYQRKITAAVRADYAGEHIIEIGPGRGALTHLLRDFTTTLTLVEKDRELARTLAEERGGDPAVRVIQTDFMAWDLAPLKDRANIVVANLPYNISTQILLRLLKNMRKFQALYLMFQQEVARRCVQGPGSKDFGILSVWCQLLSRPQRLMDVPPSAFRPRPKIVSTVLKFTPSATAYSPEVEEFMRFVKKIFSQRRKKVGGLIRDLWAETGPVRDPEIIPLLESRAEALTIGQMRFLFERVRATRNDESASQ